MGTTMKQLFFSVQGEFITQLAREKCHQEGKFEYAVELLMNCMMTDKLSEREIKQMAIEILNGEAELHGVYPGDDYGFRYLDKKDGRWNIGSTFTKLIKKSEESEKKYNDLLNKYLFLCEKLPDYQKREYNREYKEIYDEFIFPNVIGENSMMNSMLDSFIKRHTNDTEDDYGWLEPNGTFHPVEWGEHQAWADKWLQKNLPEDEYEKTYDLYMSGDYLIEKGWVLLHNPAQGIAIPTKDETKRYTKAQQDFLYQYYIDRDCHKEANSIYEE